MKKKKTTARLSLKKKTISSLTKDGQQAVMGGLTQYSTCCGSLPWQKETACCSQVSCDIKSPC